MDPSRPRLTAEQKKANHIESERKRRDAIRQGFERLSEIVPGTQGQARSEGVVLSSTVQFLREQLDRQEQLKTQALARGMNPLEFEQHYRDVEKVVRQEDEGRMNQGATENEGRMNHGATENEGRMNQAATENGDGAHNSSGAGVENGVGEAHTASAAGQGEMQGGDSAEDAGVTR